MEHLIDSIPSCLALDNGDAFWVIGGVIAIVAIFCGSVCSIFRTKARENTRREIAAYIAEGSMTPEDGERLMKAGEEES